MISLYEVRGTAGRLTFAEAADGLVDLWHYLMLLLVRDRILAQEVELQGARRHSLHVANLQKRIRPVQDSSYEA